MVSETTKQQKENIREKFKQYGITFSDESLEKFSLQSLKQSFNMLHTDATYQEIEYPPVVEQILRKYYTNNSYEGFHLSVCYLWPKPNNQDESVTRKLYDYITSCKTRDSEIKVVLDFLENYPVIEGTHGKCNGT